MLFEFFDFFDFFDFSVFVDSFAFFGFFDLFGASPEITPLPPPLERGGNELLKAKLGYRALIT